RACPDVAWHRPLSWQEESRSSLRGKTRARASRARAERVQRSVAYRADGTGEEHRDPHHRAASQAVGPAAGKHSLFPGKDRAAIATVAARAFADRAPHRAILLSAKPDQGHERGHRDLRALPHHEPPASAGPALRRQLPRI